MYGALVPYGSRAAVAIYRRKRAYAAVRAAVKAGSYAYRHRKRIRRTVATAKRVFKKKKPLRKRMQPSVKSTGKQTQPPKQPQYTNINLRIMGGAFMPNAPPPLDADDFNARDQAHVKYSGYKVCRIFENLGNQFADIWEINYAMLQFNPGFLDTLPTSPGTGLLPEQTVIDSIKEAFFRDSVNATTRVADFVDAPTSNATIWDATYNCNSMNPNKNYRIIFRKKFTLYPRQTVNGDIENARSNFRKFEFYMPVKKTMVFRNRRSTLPTTPFFEIWWSNTRSPSDWPSTNPGANTDARTLSHHFLYFRDHK